MLSEVAHQQAGARSGVCLVKEHGIGGGGSGLDSHGRINILVKGIDIAAATATETHGSGHVPAKVSWGDAIHGDVVDDEHVGTGAAHRERGAQGILDGIVSKIAGGQSGIIGRGIIASIELGARLAVVIGSQAAAGIHTGSISLEGVLIGGSGIAGEKRPITAGILGGFEELGRGCGKLAAGGGGGGGAGALPDVTLGGGISSQGRVLNEDSGGGVINRNVVARGGCPCAAKGIEGKVVSLGVHVALHIGAAFEVEREVVFRPRVAGDCGTAKGIEAGKSRLLGGGDGGERRRDTVHMEDGGEEGVVVFGAE